MQSTFLLRSWVSICSSDIEDEHYGNNNGKEFRFVHDKFHNFSRECERSYNLFLSNCILLN